jgi:hypothetical protein
MSDHLVDTEDHHPGAVVHEHAWTHLGPAFAT